MIPLLIRIGATAWLVALEFAIAAVWHDLGPVGQITYPGGLVLAFIAVWLPRKEER